MLSSFKHCDGLTNGWDAIPVQWQRENATLGCRSGMSWAVSESWTDWDKNEMRARDMRNE